MHLFVQHHENVELQRSSVELSKGKALREDTIRFRTLMQKRVGERLADLGLSNN